jgi:hypothetical protein
MAAKKKPASSQPLPLKKINRKPVTSANAAEKDMMDKKAKNRTDAAGRSGFGASTAPVYWKKGDASWKAGIKVLQSKGVDPMKYSNEKGSFKGQKPIYDYLQANTPKINFLSSKSEGMKGLFKAEYDKQAYKRISAEIRGMDNKGKIVKIAKATTDPLKKNKKK